MDTSVSDGRPNGEEWVLGCELGKVRLLMEVGRHRDALERLSVLTAAHPGDAEVLCLLSLALERLGDSAGAWDAAVRAVSLDPSWAGGHACVSYVARMTGRWEAARRAAREATRLEPHSADHWVALAHAAAGGEGRAARAEALQAARRALELDPASPEAHVALGHALRRRSPRRADKAFAEALALDPEHADARQGQAGLLWSRFRLMPAFRSLARLAGENPHDSEFVDELPSLVRAKLMACSVAFVVLTVGLGRGALHLAQTMAGVPSEEAVPLPLRVIVLVLVTAAGALAGLWMFGGGDRACWGLVLRTVRRSLVLSLWVTALAALWVLYAAGLLLDGSRGALLRTVTCLVALLGRLIAGVWIRRSEEGRAER